MINAIRLTLTLIIAAWLSPLVIAQQTPTLDVSALELIQEIPVRITKFFNDPIDARIINNIANLAILQFDMESFSTTIDDPESDTDITVIGGQFALLLRDTVLKPPAPDEGLLVEHVEFFQPEGMSPEFDEDRYRLTTGNLAIELLLGRFVARPEKDLGWGILSITTQRPEGDEQSGSENTVLAELINDGSGIIVIERVLAPNGRVLSSMRWTFEPGNPDPMSS
jgi:hypothetical protein